MKILLTLSLSLLLAGCSSSTLTASDIAFIHKVTEISNDTEASMTMLSDQVEFDTAVSILHKCKTVGESVNPANSDVENCEEFVDSSVKMLNNVDNELIKAIREPAI